jgi:hypothetical protein
MPQRAADAPARALRDLTSSTLRNRRSESVRCRRRDLGRKLHAAHRDLPAPLCACLKDEGSDVFTVDMLASVVRSLRELEQLSSEPFLLFFEPPALADRIVNQFALAY